MPVSTRRSKAARQDKEETRKEEKEPSDSASLLTKTPVKERPKRKKKTETVVIVQQSTSVDEDLMDQSEKFPIQKTPVKARRRRKKNVESDDEELKQPAPSENNAITNDNNIHNQENTHPENRDDDMLFTPKKSSENGETTNSEIHNGNNAIDESSRSLLALTIQSIYLRKLCEQDFSRQLHHLNVIQSRWRKVLAQKSCSQLRESTRLKREQMTSAVCLYQARYRGFQVRNTYENLLKSAITIQSLCSRYCVRNELIRKRKERLEELEKKKLQEEEFRKNEISTMISALFRSLINRQYIGRINQSARLIQSAVVATQQRRNLSQVICGAAMMQAAFRAKLVRSKMQKLTSAISVMQSLCVVALDRRRILEQEKQIREQIIIIESAIRGKEIRNLVKRQYCNITELQAFVRSFICARSYKNEMQKEKMSSNIIENLENSQDIYLDASLVIQALVKSKLTRSEHTHTLQTLQIIQACILGYITRKEYSTPIGTKKLDVVQSKDLENQLTIKKRSIAEFSKKVDDVLATFLESVTKHPNIEQNDHEAISDKKRKRNSMEEEENRNNNESLLDDETCQVLDYEIKKQKKQTEELLRIIDEKVISKKSQKEQVEDLLDQLDQETEVIEALQKEHDVKLRKLEEELEQNNVSAENSHIENDKDNQEQIIMEKDRTHSLPESTEEHMDKSLPTTDPLDISNISLIGTPKQTLRLSRPLTRATNLPTTTSNMDQRHPLSTTITPKPTKFFSVFSPSPISHKSHPNRAIQNQSDNKQPLSQSSILSPTVQKLVSHNNRQRSDTSREPQQQILLSPKSKILNRQQTPVKQSTSRLLNSSFISPSPFLNSSMMTSSLNSTPNASSLSDNSESELFMSPNTFNNTQLNRKRKLDEFSNTELIFPGQVGSIPTNNKLKLLKRDEKNVKWAGGSNTKLPNPTQILVADDFNPKYSPNKVSSSTSKSIMSHSSRGEVGQAQKPPKPPHP
ncbi:hypothetical protein FDP41_007743 [Naegleria fowleri]|uniref:IQ calmodulin-binding motif family protein n=1 Tax=Naegleria fowleri TaxID=5763 RepID=A0A6A5CEA7_NAEFO|nr:uncharacterized protein FDP41_007743 [Naegleria fowleri]KAF0983828.1 hypothetical protein FDP41_007743 [Naegleria fowleri]